jgi:hypothetical protein
MTGMRSWMSATSLLESVVMMAKVRIHSPEAGALVLPNASYSERTTVLHGNGVRELEPTGMAKHVWVDREWHSPTRRIRRWKPMGLIGPPRSDTNT